ncbi:lolT-1 [Arthroderma uncinatum]|uniref:lolT-1 n=1 Tax=Arthroderma uncinatum TaxID=74035 RepID=UPI00144A5E9C|nr:lolT-1 [Arthroderma uncinatum]KAF3484376.1 lolT-1 [Arthroderma uncinatum]
MGSIETPARRYERTPFGKEMLKHFSIDPTYTELNNGEYSNSSPLPPSSMFGLGPVVLTDIGSFGSVPTVILNKAHELRKRCEGRPCAFIRYEYPAGLDKSREAVARLLNAPPETIVLVANGSTGSNTIMRNFAWNPDGKDEIIQVSIIFAPLGKMTGYVGELNPGKVRTRQVQLTYPLEDDEVVALFKAGIQASRDAGFRPRLGIFDTISSIPGIRLPFERLTALCREEGVLSFIDGAHAVGHLNVDLAALDPDFFVSCCHKWLFVPRGCAALYVPTRHQWMIRSTLPLSHGFIPTKDLDQRKVDGKLAQDLANGKNAFVHNFEFVAPMDNFGYLCIPESIRWREEVCGGEKAIQTYCVNLAREGGKKIANILGTRVLDNESQSMSAACMTNVLLPLTLGGDKSEGQHIVRARPGIQFTVVDWMMRKMAIEYETMMPVFFFQGAWWVRASAQVFLEVSDFEWAGRMLEDLCERVGHGEHLKA